MHGKCDFCSALTAHRVPVSIDRAAVRTLDLCQLHYDRLLRPVVDAVTQYGAIPEKVAKGEVVNTNSRPYWLRKLGPFKCRWPGCVAPVLKNGEILERHLRNLHQSTFMEYAKVYGSDVATPEELAEPVTIECPVEGCDQVYSTQFGNRWPHHAMTSHMRGRHGLVWRPGGIGVIGPVSEVLDS